MRDTQTDKSRDASAAERPAKAADAVTKPTSHKYLALELSCPLPARLMEQSVRIVLLVLGLMI
jgi:hypothetical protein